MKKILKNKKGFTLVELIVVIAILGVLAVIMVPAFTGYIKKAEESNVLSSAKSYCTAYQAAYADLKSQGLSDAAVADRIDDETGEIATLPDFTGTSVTMTADPETGTCTVSKTN